MNTIVALCMAQALALGGPDGGEEKKPAAGGSLLLFDPDRFLAEMEAKAPPLEPAPEPKQDIERYGVGEPRPINPDTGRPVLKPTPADHWLYFAMSPYRGARNNVWHSLFNTPPVEEALGMPAKTWHPYLTIDLAGSDWSSTEGGPSRHRTSYANQIIGLDYAVSSQFLLGFRFTTGELGEGDDETIRIFKNDQQLIPTGERGFGPESLVARAKGLISFGWLDLGLAGEVKFPLADEEDLVTAQTVDIAITALATKRFRTVALHANLGVVVPTGDAKIFTRDDDVEPYIHGGLGLSWMAFRSFSFIAQLEFNTSAFKEFDILNENVIAVSLGGRYKVARNVFASASIGTGLTEDSGELILSTGIDMTF